jgi:serine/threonine-protein kinase
MNEDMSIDRTDAGRAKTVRRHFDALVERAPEEQAERLAAIDDAALRLEIASLLDAYGRSDGTIAALDELRAMLTRPVTDADPHRLVGRRIRQYVVDAHLGGGGMGVVYRARDTKLGRNVALKFLPPHLSAHPEANERFMREARAASALDHPSIGTIHEIAETEEGQIFIAMAYYAGETLKAKIARGPLPVEEAIGYAIQIAEGLQRAHEAGIIHRDVKPANVMVTNRGRVKLVDFGLARATGQPELPRTGQAPSAKADQSELTCTGQVLGTAAYMSPEQARGEAVDARTDLWSLGAVLYEMLTGRRSFRDLRPEGAIYAILNEEPKPVSALRPEVSSALASVVERCLHKNPNERYASAAALLDDLQAAHANADGTSPSASFRRWARLHPTARRLVGAAVVLLIILGIAARWVLWTSGPWPIDSVVVLPLTGSSGSMEEEYFTNGMTEALTTALSQIGALSVRSPRSAIRYKTTDTPLSVIARELSVDALVQGSVFRSDGRVRITIRLYTPDGEQLWSESYERELRDVLTLQSEVARAIAEEVQVALAPEEEAQLANTRPVNPEAHRQWLIGNHHLTLQDEATFRKALDAYQKAIDMDPGYAHAYAGMALAYTELGSWHASIPPEDVFPRAEAAAQQALALDSTVAEAHIALARVRQLYTWDWAGADRAYRRAIALNPSSTPARLFYVSYLTIMRRFEMAIEIGRKTLTLDPLSPAVYTELAFPLMFAGRKDEAMELIREALEIAPDFRQIHWLFAMLYARSDRPAKVLYHLAKLEKTDEEKIAHGWGLSGYFHAVAGQRAKARAILTQLMERRKSEYVPAIALAYVHLGLGEYDAALRWLDEAVAQRHPTAILINPPWQWLDPVRSDPRFQALRRQMGFPDS